MTQWPLQKDCDQFYGNPRGADGHASPKWEAANLVRVTPPFKMYYAKQPIVSVKFHRLCAAALANAFETIWDEADHDQKMIDKWGVSVFGGSYNFRLMRESNHPSMHSYGCAIDLDPVNHPMRKFLSPKFVPQVIKAFEAQGGVNLPRDRMHFQFARLG